MKTLLHFLRRCALFALLFIASTSCSAMMSIAQVNQARAKEMGIEIKTQPAGPEAYWVSMSFKPEGALKTYARVDLDRHDNGKLQLSAALRPDDRTAPGRITVGFTIARADVDKITLRIVAGQPMNSVGYDLRLKDFINPTAAAKPAAAVPTTESAAPAAAAAPAADRPAAAPAK